MKIKITNNHSASSYGIPVCLIDGELVDDADGFTACCKALGWSRAEAAEKLGKSIHSIDFYRSKIPGRSQSVPPNVWLVLGKALGILEKVS